MQLLMVLFLSSVNKFYSPIYEGQNLSFNMVWSLFCKINKLQCMAAREARKGLFDWCHGHNTHLLVTHAYLSFAPVGARLYPRVRKTPLNDHSISSY